MMIARLLCLVVCVAGVLGMPGALLKNKGAVLANVHENKTVAAQEEWQMCCIQDCVNGKCEFEENAEMRKMRNGECEYNKCGMCVHCT